MVSSGTILPIFIEIGSYLTDKEQKINWHSFFRHGVLCEYKYNSKPSNEFSSVAASTEPIVPTSKI